MNASNTMYAVPSAVPESPSPVASQFNELGLTIDRLESLVNEAHRKLQPVLLPTPLADEKPGIGAGNKAMCDVEESALRAGQRIHAINEHLTALLGRLQV